jgi:cellulose synthase/poly-beta-1,6-N-acetylglucosamine synthase-like glycosyltransferase
MILRVNIIRKKGLFSGIAALLLKLTYSNKQYNKMILLIALTTIFFLFLVIQVRSLYTTLVAIFASGKKIAATIPEEFPEVLIQIPVYNEGWEVKGAALAAMQQTYPRNKVLVQIIDDSEKRFPDLVAYLEEKSAEYNVNFEYVNRPHREGYKSGALNYGMALCKHELILVLDADFEISPDFLMKTVPLIGNDTVAGVQTCWSYRNKFESHVVAIQSIIFEAIFALEQSVRQKLNIPVLFTGTSGIWKRKVIDEIGGWREKPFTAEDIDLTFRSYAAGYQFIYLDEQLSSCEATPNFIAFKKQQQRWSRGVIQAGIHNMGNIIRAKQPLKSKILEISTSLYNMSPILFLLFGVLSSLYVFMNGERNTIWFTITNNVPFICIGPAALGIAYAVRKYNPVITFSQRCKSILSSFLIIGLAWSIFFGLWEILTRSNKGFVVTPKGNNKSKLAGKKRITQSDLQVILEGITFVYFGYAILYSIHHYIEALPLFILLWSGSGVSFFTSLNALRKNALQRK